MVGNPGTGKTTVAQVAGSDTNALGVLSRGHVVERTVAGSSPGTSARPVARSTTPSIAIGSVLFIDEA
jgi:replication-associated recombination protein RarA